MARIIKKIIFYLLILLLWEVVIKLQIWEEYVFPAPLTVVNTIISGFRDNSYLIAIGISMKRILIGYGLSIIVGILLGLAVGRSKLLDETVGGFLLGLQTLPSICWLPIAILWFGLNEKAIIFVVFMGAALSITIGTLDGIKNIPKIYTKVGENLGAKGFDLLILVLIPASLPAIISGMKQGWSFAWRSLMAGELLFVNLGIGQLLMMGRELNDMSQVVAVMIMIIVIGLIVDKMIFAVAERKIRERWGLS